MLETVQILHVKYMPATNTSASPTQTSDKSCKQRGEGWPAWSESDVPFVAGGGWRDTSTTAAPSARLQGGGQRMDPQTDRQTPTEKYNPPKLWKVSN